LSKTDEYRWLGWERGALPQPVVVERCAYCNFAVSAPFEQARQAFEQHVCDRPKPTTTKRRRSGFSLRA
jgi:hypothetical protein